MTRRNPGSVFVARPMVLLLVLAALLVMPGAVAATTATVVPTNGYDQATGLTLVGEGKLGLVTTSNNVRFDIAAGRWLSVGFAPGVPAGATVTSATLRVEHYEDFGTAGGAMTWQIGQGPLASPNVAGDPTFKPANLSFESTSTWNVTGWVTSATAANNLKFVIRNGSATGKRTRIDRIQLVVVYSTTPPPTPAPTPTAPPPITGTLVAAAGDVACDPSNASYNGGNGTATACRQKATSDLLVAGGYAAVLALGDLQYESGSLSGFNTSYDASWGRVKSITHPAVGNHEYGTANATGYYTYFGSAAGNPAQGYYSYDLGGWHVVVLNSNCSVVSCAAGSAQEQWLLADLAANPATCTLAYWHHPRFSSGSHGNDSGLAPFWQALYDADADLILVGHEHDYERFGPQNPGGQADVARGIRELIVGTGGRSQAGFVTLQPNSEVRMTGTYGILRLTLGSTGYEWAFVPEAGKTFSDTGQGACH